MDSSSSIKCFLIPVQLYKLRTFASVLSCHELIYIIRDVTKAYIFTNYTRIILVLYSYYTYNTYKSIKCV